MDIDECEAIPGLCDGGDCVNSAGSFQCVCPEGTAMTERQECRDRDECADGSHTCHRGRCVNTDPGFYCICEPGFIPTQDQRSCLDGRQGSCYTSLARNGQCRGRMPFQVGSASSFPL